MLRGQMRLLLLPCGRWRCRCRLLLRRRTLRLLHSRAPLGEPATRARGAAAVLFEATFLAGPFTTSAALQQVSPLEALMACARGFPWTTLDVRRDAAVALAVATTFALAIADARRARPAD